MTHLEDDIAFWRNAMEYWKKQIAFWEERKGKNLYPGSKRVAMKQIKSTIKALENANSMLHSLQEKEMREK